MVSQPPQHVTVSGFFDSEQHLESALARLEFMGIPRDLIEVIVSPEGAKRFFQGKVQKLGTEALSYAGIGALLGLLAGTLISLGTIFYFGFTNARGQAIVQLVGPNVGTMIGAALGAIIGIFVRRRPTKQHQRALGRSEILILVHDRSPEEAAAVSGLLKSVGAQEVGYV